MKRAAGCVIVLSLAIALAGLAAYGATISHNRPLSPWPAYVAIAATWLGIVPPVLGASRIANGATKQLAVVAWRLLIMLPSIALAGWWEGDERKCFFISLLACYFVALPLESCLLIREVRRSGD